MKTLAVFIPILFPILMFLVVFLLLTGIFNWFREYSRKAEIRKRIIRVAEKRKDSKAAGRYKNRIQAFLSSLGKRVVPEKSPDYSRAKLRFLRAGLRQSNAAAVYWGIKTFLMTLFPVCLLIGRITVFRIFDPTATMIICISLALFGFYLPDILLSVKIARRREEIIKGLPDALDLLVVCVEAGLGLDAAFDRVANEISLSDKALSDELKLLNRELRAGKPRRDALRNLALRTDVEDLKSLVTMLVQTDRFGTSVAQALRVYSDSFRTKRYQRAEEIAARLPVKLVFPCILFIFPSMFVVILGPALIRISQTLLHH